MLRQMRPVIKPLGKRPPLMQMILDTLHSPPTHSILSFERQWSGGNVPDTNTLSFSFFFDAARERLEHLQLDQMLARWVARLGLLSLFGQGRERLGRAFSDSRAFLLLLPLFFFSFLFFSFLAKYLQPKNYSSELSKHGIVNLALNRGYSRL